jgi:hypothetical protein
MPSPTRGNYLSTTYAVRTTDATATVLKSIPVYTGAAIYIIARFMARVEGATGDVLAGRVEGWFYDVSGAATAAGAQESLTVKSDESDAWTFAIAASGANVVATVTGAAATSMRWFAEIEVHEVRVPSSGF